MAGGLQDFSDYLLLEQCRQDNVKAYNVLFDRYSKRLYLYGMKYLKNEAVAEEAMMDVMVWVWEKRQQLDPDVQFASYIFRAMKNAVLKSMTRKSPAVVPIETVADHPLLLAQPADSNMHYHALVERYQEDLLRLSLQRRRVFTLSRQENLSHAEIAKTLNLSLHTVKNHVKASLSHFRQYLKEYNDITSLVITAWMFLHMYSL